MVQLSDTYESQVVQTVDIYHHELYQCNIELLHRDERDQIPAGAATFKMIYTEHQLLVSPYWSGHCHHTLQICTCVHSLSCRRSQTWTEVCPLSCEKPPFKEKINTHKNVAKWINHLHWFSNGWNVLFCFFYTLFHGATTSKGSI